MKKFVYKFSFRLLITVFIFCFATSLSAQKRKLVWSDEFNYTGLPNSRKWSYEIGHVRNYEKQYYTRARKENARVENGCLIIEGRKEIFVNTAYDASRTNWKFTDSLAAYTSASIKTIYKKYFQYGRIEVKAKLPKGLGIWPAIWMLGKNSSTIGWPWCGEIDIMEFVGHDSTHIHGTLHYPVDTAGKLVSSGNKIQTKDPYNNFHVYAIEWTQQKIDFYFDDSLYHSFKISKATFNKRNPFQKPFYLIINLALGGSWGGTIDNKILPQQFLVDYVRIYR